MAKITSGTTKNYEHGPFTVDRIGKLFLIMQDLDGEAFYFDPMKKVDLQELHDLLAHVLDENKGGYD